jgi:hypothetical protein
LYCLHFFVSYCIVCTSSLPFVLSVPLLYPLYCLYLFFTHLDKEEVQTIQWIKKRYRQYNG